MSTGLSEFEATVHSLGEWLVSNIGREHLRALEIQGSEASAAADVTITLASDTWDEQCRAIERVLEAVEMFSDEIVVDYRFTRDRGAVDRARKSAAFTYA